MRQRRDRFNGSRTRQSLVSSRTRQSLGGRGRFQSLATSATALQSPATSAAALQSPATSAAIGAALVLSLCASAALADDQPPSQRELWGRQYEEIAKGITLRAVEEDRSSELKLLPKPLLSYANPVRTWQQHGDVFLWLKQDRPAAIGSIWSVVDRKDKTLRNVALEFHSLLTLPLAGEREDESFWRCDEPALQWNRVPGAAPPAATRALRLIQMRAINRGLTAMLDETETKLRLMPQPLHRSPESAEVDGAVFCFVLGTDPEVFVVMEARGAAAKPAWHWAFARFTHVPGTVRYKDQTVFQWKHRRESLGLTKYFIRFKAERLPALLEPTSD